MKTLRLIAPAVVLFVLGTASVADAQVTDTERFRVTVPSQLTITAPQALVSITHDETDADQPFPPQPWNVTANALLGATVSFSTDQAFTHTLDPTFKRDARLDLSVASSDAPAAWTVLIGSDQTDYDNLVLPDEVATVTAASIRPGDASFNLGVTFLTVDHSTLAEGDYEMTVTGTLTAN